MYNFVYINMLCYFVKDQAGIVSCNLYFLKYCDLTTSLPSLSVCNGLITGYLPSNLISTYSFLYVVSIFFWQKEIILMNPK